MATQTYRTPRAWVAGFDLSTYIASFKMGAVREEKDATTIGDSGVRGRLAGMRGGMVELGGFYDVTGALGPDDVLFSRVGTVDIPISFSPTNNSGAEGEVAYTLLAGEFGYDFGDKVGEVMPFSVTGTSTSGPLVRGTVLHNATRTATGTGTAFNLGAVSASQRVYIAVHALASTGTGPSLQVTLQSATAQAFSSPTSRITLGALATQPNSAADSLAGAITDTWWRVSYTITGTNPSIPFIAVVGIA